MPDFIARYRRVQYAQRLISGADEIDAWDTAANDIQDVTLDWQSEDSELLELEGYCDA